jgi:O-antigen ligase
MGPFEWILVVNSSILLVKNDVVFLSILAPFALALVFRSSHTITKVIAVSSIVLTIFVVGVYQSRIAMLTLLLSIICFFSLIRPKVGFFLIILASASILLIDWFMGFPLIERFINHWDGSGRIPLWLCAWNMFLDSPLIGQGPHTFVDFYQAYIQNITLPSWIFVDTRIIPWPHNLYLEVLSEQGIIGLSAFSFLLISATIATLKLRKAVSDDVRIFSYAVFAGLVSFCTAALVELTFLRQWVVVMMFIFLGIIGFLLNISKNERRRKDEGRKS